MDERTIRWSLNCRSQVFELTILPTLLQTHSIQNCFLNMAKSWPLFHLFCTFLITLSITISIIQIQKCADGMHGIQTRGHRMVGADKTTELWRPPLRILLVPFSSVTRLYDLLDFRQLFQASGNNYFTQIAHILSKFCKGVKSFIFMVKSFLGSPL